MPSHPMAVCRAGSSCPASFLTAQELPSGPALADARPSTAEPSPRYVPQDPSANEPSIAALVSNIALALVGVLLIVLLIEQAWHSRRGREAGDTPSRPPVRPPGKRRDRH